MVVTEPQTDDTWVGLIREPLPIDSITKWVARPDCGAVVVFSGNARDHAEGRPGVSKLEYEAYTEIIVPRLAAITAKARELFSDIGRIAIVHRVGVVEIGESAVVVAVSSPHRDTAFSAARYGIDTVKATVPIWKRETWEGGQDWGLKPQHIVEVEAVGDNLRPEELCGGEK